MPLTEPSVLTGEGTAEHADPVAALRTALAAAMASLAPHKVTPADLTRVSIATRTEALLHPARAAVDLSLRELLGGFRPPIDLSAHEHNNVTVRIEANAPRPMAPDALPHVWGGFSFAELAREYSPRAFVPDMAAIFDAWRRDGAAFREKHLAAELSYGPTRGEAVDLYLPEGRRGPLPLWVFIHGGYWQAVDKAHNGQFAAGMLAAGYAVAVPNYTLAPTANLHEIVRQTQTMVAFLAREARALGCDPSEIHLAGHSAGGHLAALLATLPEGRLVRSALPLSGIFDLAPLAHLTYAHLLGLDDAVDLARLSPQHLRPLPHIHIGAAAGGAESGEFQRQTLDFARAWSAPSRIIAGRHHFNLLDGLCSGDLLDFAREIAALGR